MEHTPTYAASTFTQYDNNPPCPGRTLISFEMNSIEKRIREDALLHVCGCWSGTDWMENRLKGNRRMNTQSEVARILTPIAQEEEQG